MQYLFAVENGLILCRKHGSDSFVHHDMFPFYFQKRSTFNAAFLMTFSAPRSFNDSPCVYMSLNEAVDPQYFQFPLAAKKKLEPSLYEPMRSPLPPIPTGAKLCLFTFNVPPYAYSKAKPQSNFGLTSF